MNGGPHRFSAARVLGSTISSWTCCRWCCITVYIYPVARTNLRQTCTLSSVVYNHCQPAKHLVFVAIKSQISRRAAMRWQSYVIFSTRAVCSSTHRCTNVRALTSNHGRKAHLRSWKLRDPTSQLHVGHTHEAVCDSVPTCGMCLILSLRCGSSQHTRWLLGGVAQLGVPHPQSAHSGSPTPHAAAGATATALLRSVMV